MSRSSSRQTPPGARKAAYHHGDLKNALIRAGVEILSKEGVAGLSLRRVAQRAGVSHAAPYAHFTDKQALIAAISTEGYRKLYGTVGAAVERGDKAPAAQLVAGAWAYVQFALEDPAHFKVTMSGVVEREKDYPAFVEMSRRNLALLEGIVKSCQDAGILKPGPAELLAVSAWSAIHGFVSLVLEGQISRTILDRFTLKEMLLFTLNQFACVDLGAELLSDDSGARGAQ